MSCDWCKKKLGKTTQMVNLLKAPIISKKITSMEIKPTRELKTYS
jgi:hypothetical protein